MTKRKNKHKGSTDIGASEGKPADSNDDRILIEPLGMKTLNVQREAVAKNSDNPLVSVIIPTYNRAWALGKSVRSVFEQTYRPIECIIVDDGSTDNTTDIVKHLIDECPEHIDVRYFIKENGGANSARNRGLFECSGDFICYLDSDDMLTRDSIDERARVLIEDSDVDFCYGLSSIRDEHGTEIGRLNESWPASDKPIISHYLFDTNSPLIRRSACAMVGLWREDIQGFQEYEYFSRLKHVSKKVYFINKILNVYVKHKDENIYNKSLSYSLSRFKCILIVKSLVLYGKHDNIHERKCLSKMFRSSAVLLYRSKDYSTACAALQESMTLNFNLKVLAQWIALRFIGLLKTLLSR